MDGQLIHDMEGLYIRVGWPDYQEYQEKEGFADHSKYCADTNEYFIEQDWAFQNQNDDCEDEDLKKALARVRGEVDQVHVGEAIKVMGECHCPLGFANENLANKIQDVLEEYGEDNDLPEGWWMEFGDLDDIVLML